MFTSVLLGGVCAASLLGTLAARNFSRRAQLFDHPNDRSSHSDPTPRLGGIAISTAALAGWAVALWAGHLAPSPSIGALVAGTTVAALVGLIDDLRQLTPVMKFAGQVVAALVATTLWDLTFPAVPVWLTMAIVIGWLVLYTNQFNFMDGSDGLAAASGIISAAGIAAVAYSAGAPDTGLIAAIVAGAAAGFLCFNFPPASIFMGDAGSHFLGFALAVLVVQLVDAGVATFVALTPLAPFILDSTFTIARRLARGEQVWRAHREHIYQRLLSAGWSSRGVMTLYAAWGAWSVCGAWAAARSPEWRTAAAGVLVAQVGFVSLVWWLVRRAERNAPRLGRSRPATSGLRS
jgi:Fuc2NAc and GlcNAc transferase